VNEPVEPVPGLEAVSPQLEFPPQLNDELLRDRGGVFWTTLSSSCIVNRSRGVMGGVKIFIEKGYLEGLAGGISVWEG
tara:strand:- start:2701 stop:2934 length:234 start_codon:yes stop_codon:yes gene_type:complete